MRKKWYKRIWNAYSIIGLILLTSGLVFGDGVDFIIGVLLLIIGIIKAIEIFKK